MKHPFDLHPRHRRRAAYSRSRPSGFRPRRARPNRGGLVTMLLAGLFAGLLWTRLPEGAGVDQIVPSALLAEPDAAARSNSVPAGVRASFSLCHSGGGINCVVDGDTFWMAGEKIRIADIDTPETHPARCAREAELGAAATQRLRELLNGGAVTLTAIDRDTDRYGRKLRIASVDGVGVGETLVAEGLARRYEGGRRAGWCD
jgi:endonuclease YncB( thermonuclease family)